MLGPSLTIKAVLGKIQSRRLSLEGLAEADCSPHSQGQHVSQPSLLFLHVSGGSEFGLDNSN